MSEAGRRRIVPRLGGLELRGQALLLAFHIMVRAGLRGVWVRGEVPTGPVVWATNHHHWWDAFAAGSILRGTRQRPTVLVAAASLEAYPFLHWIGAVPATDPDRAIRALRAGRPLIIMPEGRLVGPGPLGPIRGGAGRIAETAGVPLLPVSLRVVVRGSQHPEVFVDIGVPVAGHELEAAMSSALTELDEAIATSDPEVALPGYRLVVRGRSSVNERFTALAERGRR